MRQCEKRVFDSLPSTQTYLLEKLKNNELKAPILIVAKNQSAGIGSRGNIWESAKSALTFSLALNASDLPKDLPMQANALYLGFLFKEVLKELGSQTWLKWPNDLYLGGQKIGGVLVNVYKGMLVCGIGVNRVSTKWACLDIGTSDDWIIEGFLKKIEENLFWGEVLSKYALEFHRNDSFSFHNDWGELVSLKDAQLLEDGRICIKGKIYDRM
ncbi:biotin--[acetyl-CoA-carboxylase] ligase [Helicobacter pylori]|uniref:Biotin-[acetyl-CoA-carboxylase] ligase n=1 Tax=Helicobacter pylori (strain B8) TaxID=693745 RepID=D7FCL1_HELP3|nr:biotin--[acetyl-CoA-carboxylase] ligase [Helicobacter pylori]AVG73301.1 biotin--[acetyl-CoA-carboxylase] ligase [Helicobacter pylori]AVG79348.1 biotin--[acetyl-CoA-carboxylase] ligase [Helicobacter pylori]AVG80822.1 biotin--[acetyl-CoA-carboxylase] ligase [Helicobacter pylori]AVG83667.1 biotin--[acetyl-CoA-carboxylase] ligase [Helicobacter pylori]AVG85102.1 biotin--[acetyl-CoA-carboxylase] ligase [Helicobacter pylori]